MREPVADPETGLSVLLPFSAAAEEWRIEFAHGGDDAAEAVGDFRAGEAVEFGFGVEEVDVAGAAFHEEEDDGAGFWWEVRGWGGAGGGLAEEP